MRKLTKPEAELLGNALKHGFSGNGLFTQEEIEGLTKVDQTQISRILRGEFRKVTPKVEELCKYAGVDPEGELEDNGNDTQDRNGHDRILRAFEMVWDGTKEHAEAIAHLILATRRLSSRQPSTGIQKNKRG